MDCVRKECPMMGKIMDMMMGPEAQECQQQDQSTCSKPGGGTQCAWDEDDGRCGPHPGNMMMAFFDEACPLAQFFKTKTTCETFDTKATCETKDNTDCKWDVKEEEERHPCDGRRLEEETFEVLVSGGGTTAAPGVGPKARRRSLEKKSGEMVCDADFVALIRIIDPTLVPFVQ